MTSDETSPAKAGILFCVALGAAAGIILLLQYLLGLAAQSPSIAELSSATLEGGFILILFGLLGSVAVLGFLTGGTRPAIGPRAPAAAGAGVAIGVAGLLLAIGLSTVAGVTHGGDAPRGTIGLLLVGTLLTLFQTSVEELYFRGWLQPALQSGWGRWPGLAATAFAFAALHFVNGGFNPVSLFSMMLAGLLFGLLRERSGGLALPIGAHFGWNWAEELLMGVTPNPGTGSFGALFDLNFIGSPWWGGSETGLNESLSAVFALLALVVAVTGWRGLASRPAA